MKEGPALARATLLQAAHAGVSDVHAVRVGDDLGQRGDWLGHGGLHANAEHIRPLPRRT